MLRRRLAARLCAGASLVMLAAPAAMTQTSPVQGTSIVTPAAEPSQPVYTPTSLAPSGPVPRTRDGHPDFQNVVWHASFFAMIEATPMLPQQLMLPEDQAKQAFDRTIAMFTGNPAIKKLLDADPEASSLLNDTAGLPIVRGERRTRLVVAPADGKLPLTPAARGLAMAAANPAAKAPKADNPEERTLGERCFAMGGQAPMAMMSPLHPRQFVQTKDHIVINSEYGDEVRIIPFAAAHRSAELGPSMGDAIARWEGDTLVLETTSFPARERLRGAFPTGLPLNPDSKVIERYTRIGADELLYQFTIEDPKLYTAPWLAEYSLYRAPYRMYPSSCHEGNYSLANILSGQRVADNRTAGTAH
jgi:hypothetical protein